MRLKTAAVVLILFALPLAACGTLGPLGEPPASNGLDAQASATTEADATPANPSASLLGADSGDDLSTGKKFFRAGSFGLAEQHFRRAVETHPGDGEAWLGLAASYDRLRRFDFADRAYAQAIRIVGETPEILNNQGYSYMLRGDYNRAREKLAAAQRKAPDNVFVQNNLRLLAESTAKGKAIR